MSNALNKLISIRCFGIYVPFNVDNTHVVLFKKKNVNRVCTNYGQMGIVSPTVDDLHQGKIYLQLSNTVLLIFKILKGLLF